MVTPYLLAIMLLLFSLFSFAEDEQCSEELASRCKSQLLRVTVSPDSLSQSKDSVLPLLQQLADAPKLHGILEREYDIPSVAMPPDKEECKREKAEGDSEFQNIDCEDENLCSGSNLTPELKERLCFNLPCSLLAGPDADQCPDATNVPFTGISFPEPLKIERIRFTPTKVNFDNNQAQMCFRIEELSLNLSTRLEFDSSGTSLRDKGIGISNIKPTLDGPREVCAEARIDLGSPTPVSQIKITPQGTGPFISDEMIKAASSGLQIQGLSGYSAQDVKKIQADLVPRLFHPVRDSVEEGVSEALAEAFDDELKERFSRGSTTFVDGRSYISELGIQNMEALEQMKILECSQLYEAVQYQRSNVFHLKTPEAEAIHSKYQANYERKCKLPELHPVYNTEYVPGFKPAVARAKLAEAMKDKKVTSESVKRRLMAIKEVMLEEPASGNDHVVWHPNEQSRQKHLKRQKEKMAQRYEEEIAPLIAQIEKNQSEANLPNLIGQVLSGKGPTPNGLDFGLSLPELCNELGSSPLANRRIENCPIQVYADLKQFNGLLNRMWENGQLCMKGSGPKYTGKGSSRKHNPEPCTLEMGGMTCQLDSAPQLKSIKGNRYNVSVKLKDCSRPPAFLIFGAFGGDLDIDYSFKPKACENGDFCIDDPKPSWSVVRGSETGALRPDSMFNKAVQDGLNQAINGALGKVIRIPLASAVSGPMSHVPLKSEGRVDSGPGYFGVCLEVDSGSLAK